MVIVADRRVRRCRRQEGNGVRYDRAERYNVIVDFSGVPVGGHVRRLDRLGAAPAT